MKPSHIFAAVVCCLPVFCALLVDAAQAADPETRPTAQVFVSGGLGILNSNDTALPEALLNIPLTATAGCRFTRHLAAEGEFSYLLPVKREIDVAAGLTADRKTPPALVYQANLIASLPLDGSAWSPYLAAGGGAVTFLSNDDADRLPQLSEAQTMFALNFGAGVTGALTPHWLVRADFREFAAFPSDDAEGFSDSGSADPIWMERISVGVGYRF